MRASVCVRACVRACVGTNMHACVRVCMNLSKACIECGLHIKQASGRPVVLIDCTIVTVVM